MFFYMIFALSFVVFYGNVEFVLARTGVLRAAMVGLGGIGPHALFMLLFAALYWGIGFGVISRRMEQEADLYALENTEEPGAFASALEKLAVTDYVPRRSSFWRHFSIERRTDFLHKVLNDPELGDRYRKRVRRIRWGFCLVAAGALANLLFLYSEFFLTL
jgi:Zn-dependent protease with chaperone function